VQLHRPGCVVHSVFLSYAKHMGEKMKSVRLAGLLTFLLTLAIGILPSPSPAQVSNGSISGDISDPQGSAVPQATITATNKATNREITTTSDNAGLFRLSLVPPGTYRVEISKQGFRKAAFDNVEVAVGADRGLGTVKLEIGEVTATVEVSGALPLVENTEAQVTNAFTAANIQAFPGIQGNEGLDFLALTVPGVVNNRDLGFSNSNGPGFAVNGIRGRNNDQQIDGQNNNDNSVAGPALFVSDPEFVQEYQITTSNFSPEYGRNSGSVINQITKSGTNTVHGSVYGNESNSVLNALSNTQKAFEGLKKPARFNDEFTGGTIGGPLWADHVFFFGGFDNQIVSQKQVYTSGADNTGGSVGSLTPTPNGIATLLACYGNTPSLQALQTFGPFAIKDGNPSPVPGTITSATMLTNCTDGTTRALELAQVERTLSTGSKAYNFPMRLDIQTAKNHFYGRYLFNRSTLYNADSFFGGSAGYPNNVPALAQDYGFSWVRTVSSRMTNEFRASYGRINVQFGGNALGTVPVQGNIGQALARVSFNGTANLGFGPATNEPQGRIVNTYQFQDNWSYFQGRHGLKAGVNFTYQRSPNIFLPNFNGSYRFSNWATFGADTPNRIQIAQGSPSLDFREKDTFLYFGDDFKVKNNLTLNLGVTWSYYGQPANLFHTITVKNQSGSSPLWNPAVPTSATEFPTIPAPGNSWGPGVGFAWIPGRGGFLTGHGKTTVRGGYRLAYDPPYYNIYINISSSAPIVFLQTLSTTAGSLPVGTHQLLATPTGPNVRADLASALVRGVFDPRTFNDTSITPDFGPQKTHEWSFGVQRELGGTAVFEARYVGNHALNLFQTVNGNPRIDGLLAAFPSLVPAGLTPCTTATTILGPGQTSHPELGRVDCNQGIVRRRTNTAYSDYNGVQLELRSTQLWHQLALKTNYTYSKTTDNASEIFSTFGGGGTQAFSQNQLNFTGQEHGLSGLDFRHAWTLSAYEELPFYRSQPGILGHILGGWGVAGTYFITSGQPYTPVQFALNSSPPRVSQQPYYDNGFVNAFYGTVDQALRPYLANASAPVTQVGIYAADACNLFSVGCTQTATTLLSLNAINATGAETVVTNKDVRFIANTPTANTVFNTPFGNVGRNTLRDAWSNISNLQFFKTIKVKENFKVQWHMSMLNAFNHPNFSSVDPFLDDAGLASEGSGFGIPALTSGGLQNGIVGAPGRKISFGIKLFW
jgi:Carboxypeptidase regulatory-like domain